MSTVPTIGTIGQRLDLLIRQGATFDSGICTARNPAIAPATLGTPVDLTGCTIRAQLRKKASDVAPAADFAITSAYDNTGTFSFGLTATQTSAIPTGSDVTRPESLYVWDLELIDSLGRVTPLLWGDARVHREVTRG